MDIQPFGTLVLSLLYSLRGIHARWLNEGTWVIAHILLVPRLGQKVGVRNQVPVGGLWSMAEVVQLNETNLIIS